MSLRILVVEDEPALARMIAKYLSEAAFEVDVAHDIREALDAVEKGVPDLMLLDLMLPDGDGLDLLTTFRQTNDCPVLLLTARDTLQDRVSGLDKGADDYLVKPFQLEELHARIRALLRRSRGDGSLVDVGDLRIDLSRRRVTRGGRLLYLSTTEYSVLELLARNLGQAVSKAAILGHVWDDSHRGANLVEVYVNYLRNKLERGGASRLVHTVRGKGYALAEEPID